MFKRSRKLRRLSKKLEKFEPYEVDENGNRLIRLHVQDDDYFLSPMSVEGVPCISDETAYLLNFYLKNMSVDSDEKLHFLIKGHNLTEKEREKYKRAIYNYYKEEFIDVQDQLKRNLATAGIMGLVGFLVLLGLFFAKKALGYFIVTEILQITEWVFIWAAVDQFFIRRPELKIKQLQNLKVLEAQIDFEEWVYETRNN